MKKKLLFAAIAAVCFNLGSFAQTNLAQGITPTKLEPIVTGTNIPETLVGLTDGLMNNIYLMPEPSVAGATIQAFSIDLGASHDLGTIKIYWEGAAASDFVISASEDNSTWTAIVEKTGLGQRTEDVFPLTNAKGRYIKFAATNAVNYGWGVKMREFEVYKPEAAVLTGITSTASFVMKGQETDLGIKTTDQYGSDFTGTITITTDNGTITDGKLTATSGGKCTITAADENGNSISTTVYVLDEIMAPGAPIVDAADAYGIYGQITTEDKTASWQTWAGTTFMDEISLGSAKVKPIQGGTKVNVGFNETNDKFLNYENTEYDRAVINVFPSKDIKVEFISEGTQIKSTTMDLVEGKWQTIILSGISMESNTIKCINLATVGGAAFPAMLISDIYLVKSTAETGMVIGNADDRGFVPVTGTIKASDVETMKTIDGTAFDLSNAKLGEGISTITFKNPNAIISVAGTTDENGTPTDDWGKTKNVVVKRNDGYYFPVKQLEITDKYPVYTDYFISGTVGFKYTRTLAANSCSTIYLPGTSSVILPDGCKAYEMSEGSKVNTIKLTEVTSLNALTPYIVFNGNDTDTDLVVEGSGGDVKFQADQENTKVIGNLTAKGNFQCFKGDGSQYGLQNQSSTTLTLKKVKGGIICPFRVYFTVANEDAAAKISFVIDEDEASAINSASILDAVKSNVYSLDGRLVKTNVATAEGLAKGIYVINGKKVIVK